MFCKKCGKELLEGARFCAGCGAPTNIEQSAPAPSARPTYTARAYPTRANYSKREHKRHFAN